MLKNNREILNTILITHLLPLYEDKFPLIFFWSPKSGCTSLIKWFFFQIGLFEKAIDYNPWVHFYRMEVFEKQINYNLKIKEQLLGDKKDVYKLVRNPYNRAVSSFLATFFIKSIMNEIAPDINNGLSFKQFLYKIKDIGVEKSLINLHIAQQYVEGEELFIKNYVSLENFENEIRDIEKKYNLLKSPIPNIIKSPHHMAPKMIGNSNQTYSEVKLSLETVVKSPLPLYKNFYDEETKALVRELFKKDFEKYGYSQNNLN